MSELSARLDHLQLSSEAPEPAGVDTVRDRDGGAAAALAAYPDHVLLPRPDHYVAACMGLGEIEHGADAVGALVDSTMNQPAARLCASPEPSLETTRR